MLQLGGVQGGDWQLVLSSGELQRAGLGTVGGPVALHGKTLCLGERFERPKCDMEMNVGMDHPKSCEGHPEQSNLHMRVCL